MHLDEEGTQDNPRHFWRTRFPWNIDPPELLDNKAAVATVMHATEKTREKF